MKVTHAGRKITVDVTSDGEGLVSHAGSALLAQVADKSGLSRALSSELDGLQLRAGSHDRGRGIRDLAVMLADGGDCLADVGALSDQAILFGDVASSSTAFRVIDRSPAIVMVWTGCAPLTLVLAHACGSSAGRRSG